MLPFKTLIVVDKNLSTPVYLQIANSLISLIRNGVIKPGSSLPASREMASLLQVHRKTVVAAYEELYAQDWIETIPRKGVTVSQNLPEIKPRTFKAVSQSSGYTGKTDFSFHKIISVPAQAGKAAEYRLILNDGFPDARIAPVDLLMKEYRRLFHTSAIQRLTAFIKPAGSLNLRKAIVQFLSDTRGLNIGTQNILMTHGAQMAIFMTARMILKPGSTVVVAEPNYFMANEIFQQCGAKLIRVGVDENGIDVDAIEKICKKKKPDLLYIIPHHHHPTTVTLSAERRMRLLQLIRTYKLPVIEDDYDYDFHYSSSPILPLASADHEGNVIYIGSISKTLATSIRIGYMIAPENFIKETVQLRKLIDIWGDGVLEEALAVLFNNGTMQRHLKKSVNLYRQRRDMLCTLMQKELGDYISFHEPSGGMAVWVKFNKKYSLPVIAHRASAQGLYMSDGSFYNTEKINYNASRIGFASLNEKEMEEAINILKKVM